MLITHPELFLLVGASCLMMTGKHQIHRPSHGNFLETKPVPGRVTVVITDLKKIPAVG